MKFNILSLALFSFFAGCSTSPAADPCEEATDLITECYGEEKGAMFQCNPAQAEEIAGLNCAELVNLKDKSDGFWCKLFNTCDSEPIFSLSNNGVATKYPVVIAHGFSGSSTNQWGLNSQVADALRSIPNQKILLANVSPFKKVTERAAELALQIDAFLLETKAEKVHIIAHSMGGLDARHLISTLNYGDRVASLVTISTPHKGSAVADKLLAILPGQKGDVVDLLAGVVAKQYTTDDLADNSDLRGALNGISVAASDEFNAQNPAVDGVYYQSWAGVSSVLGIANAADFDACHQEGGKTYFNENNQRDTMDAGLLAGAAILAGTNLTPNDGMVTVDSAIYGEFKGCIPADHYDEIGQSFALVGVNEDERMDTKTGFDALVFYKNIIFDLAKRDQEKP